MIEHAGDAGLDLLTPALAGADLHVVRAYAGDPLPAVAELEGLIVLGGAANVHDDDATPYLPALRTLLADAVERHVPTLGICLGAQLLAVAAGGQVQVEAPAGVEAGVVEVRLRPGAEDDPVLGALAGAQGNTVVVPTLHFDAITELPEGAQWLAASRQYPYQAFRLGSALGVQFHPEVSGPALASWVRQLEAGDAEQIEADWDQAGAQITQAADLLAGAFLAQVREHVGALDPV